jgi:type VI secretion system protein VasD
MASCSPRSVGLKSAGRRPVLAAAALLVLGLSNCAPPPPPPIPPTIAYVQINTTSDVNGLPGAPGAPIALRVYQLASADAFTGAEFYPLYTADKVALGADLLKKDEMVLTPSSTKSMTLTPADQVKTLAVFGAFATFGTVIWRVSADIPAHQTTTFTITASSAGLKLVATPGKPAIP